VDGAVAFRAVDEDAAAVLFDDDAGDFAGLLGDAFGFGPCDLEMARRSRACVPSSRNRQPTR
jgi:hypothetical protein